MEFKSNATDLDKIRQAVCAFTNDLANHRAPGVVFVGMHDDGRCADLDIGDDLLRRLAQIRDDGSLTAFPGMEVRKAVVSGCDLAVIVVQPSDNPPVRFNGRTWIRVGPRRAIATPEEESRLVKKRRFANLAFDARPVPGASVDDLDLDRFRSEYLPALVSHDTLAQNRRA